MQFLRIAIVMATLTFNGFAQSMTQADADKIVTTALKKFNIPALSVAVMDSNKVYAHSIQGTRKASSQDPVSNEDYFHLGSCSKSLLATIAGKLVEQGKISWETKFFELFPELKPNSNSEYYTITLQDLFTCEAGIKPFTTSEELFPSIVGSASNKRYEFARWLLIQPASSPKNTIGKFQHLYSNAGYTLAALMLETASGLSWENLVTGMMDELNMKIGFGFPVKLNSQQPWGHGYFEYDSAINTGTESKTLRAFGPDDEYQLNALIAPAGDLSMPPSDYAAYTRMHLQGLTGNDNYLKKETWKHIHFFRKGFSVGVGNSIYHKKQVTGFDGSAGTFYCRSIILPKDNLAFTIMTNAGSPQAVDWVTRKIMKRYYNWWWKVWM